MMTELTETNFRKAIKQVAHPQRSRSIENWGLGIASGVVAIYGLAYAVSDFLIRIGKVPQPGKVGFPWVLLILVGALVLPKTLGRATTGKIWEAAINKFASNDK